MGHGVGVVSNSTVDAVTAKETVIVSVPPTGDTFSSDSSVPSFQRQLQQHCCDTEKQGRKTLAIRPFGSELEERENHTHCSDSSARGTNTVL